MSDPTMRLGTRPSGLPTLRQQHRFWDWHRDHLEERKVVNDWMLRRADEIIEARVEVPYRASEHAR